MSNGTTCWGMILRNHAAAVIYAATKKENVHISPLLAEALGMRWALLWLKENNYENVEMETDAEQVVKCFKNQIKLSEISNVILDCVELAKSIGTKY
jgi:ribonuclease HI